MILLVYIALYVLNYQQPTVVIRSQGPAVSFVKKPHLGKAVNLFTQVTTSNILSILQTVGYPDIACCRYF